jgi:hypothetical protein
VRFSLRCRPSGRGKVHCLATKWATVAEMMPLNTALMIQVAQHIVKQLVRKNLQ